MRSIARIFFLVILAASIASGQSASERVAEIRQDQAYQSALEFIGNDHERWVAELIELTEIPAPPFKEEQRARAYLEKLRQVGLTDVAMDEEGNVMGIRKGSGGPLLAVAAHLDTVFPEGTNVTVKREGMRLVRLEAQRQGRCDDHWREDRL